ncbi:protein of unknown function [Citrobacter amalonaticus]|uniref:Uncharacterized protein n=1 Tax=Citrobacter amalonaticus TaxID=35703 RepID=A0AAX2BK28_CITAM|nr:protein of unknown function [Citrobacter amalonaticus]SAZ79944.1 protein of unknown function [Citrobacter amalonaticus]
MDAGSTPTRQADGIRRMNHEVAIFLAGSQGCKGGGGEPPLHVHVYCGFRESLNTK